MKHVYIYNCATIEQLQEGFEDFNLTDIAKPACIYISSHYSEDLVTELIIDMWHLIHADYTDPNLEREDRLSLSQLSMERSSKEHPKSIPGWEDQPSLLLKTKSIICYHKDDINKIEPLTQIVVQKRSVY